MDKIIMDTKKIETALRKARKYIRTVDGFLETGFRFYTFQEFMEDQKEAGHIEGNEIKATEDALLELGIVV